MAIAEATVKVTHASNTRNETDAVVIFVLLGNTEMRKVPGELALTVRE
jgi:hypothetical protein